MSANHQYLITDSHSEDSMIVFYGLVREKPFCGHVECSRGEVHGLPKELRELILSCESYPETQSTYREFTNVTDPDGMIRFCAMMKLKNEVLKKHQESEG